MKTYKLMAMCIAGLLLVSCENKLSEGAELQVGVATNDEVSLSGDVITVKKGTPIEFTLGGEPDFITFYSGETNNKYEYKDRVTVDEKEIESSKLTFSIWTQYGNAACTEKVLSMYISDSFEGLMKNNFKADSVLVESHSWKELVPQSELPQIPLGSAAKALSYSIDMKPYLGKRTAIAICYKAILNTSSQPKVYFEGMKIENKMSNGQETSLYASGFGLTPLNMKYKHWTTPPNLANNPAYGSVTNNTNGYWNLVGAATGAFFVHSSGAGDPLRYSWLVSNLLVTNSCSPDKGVNIKNITQAVNSYSHTYNEAGTYTATFVASSANYEYDSSMTRQLTIKVVE